ncbi:hypothetical protein CLPUN_50850 [Clostridium puniceum]|uniref:Uncharacterized protein n=1 Tax=Clostridium puniceum TaxID=29367 RepID=A0A1S8T0A4_9CLOT|nr:hypothetical protein [Clostridium puniceum]OOM71093.1 hypothetical protein CLPUN_50850 [Clostridium puniceum]
MTKLQELLGKILKSRIEREIEDGILETDKANLCETLDIFMASKKITSEQYKELAELATIG